ncbi:MAG: tetratricopeptide repeat protein [Chloroflexi bacterium]|nr:tetratricopeptide repeat protein [Chloroflexota bacterium]
MSRLELEHDNLRVALGWAVKAQPEYGLRLAAALSEFWDTHGHLTEGRKWLEAALKARSNLPPTPTRVKALYGAMGLAIRQTDVASGLALSAEGFALAQTLDYKPGIADGFALQGMVTEHFENDMTRANAFYDQALESWRALGDRRRIGQALGPLASRALRHYKYAEAEKLFAESLSLFREVEDEREIAGALWNLAEVANLRGDYELARTRADDSFALYRELDDKHGIATALRALSEAMQNQGRLEQAISASEQSVGIFSQLNDRGCLGTTLCVLARQIQQSGDLQRASALAGEAVRIAREIGHKHSASAALETLGSIALAQGDAAAAQQQFHDGLMLQYDLKDMRCISSLLRGCACLAAALKQPDRAARLLGAVEALWDGIGARPAPADHAAWEREAVAARAQLDESTFNAARDEGRAMTMDQAIEFAMGYNSPAAEATPTSH